MRNSFPIGLESRGGDSTIDLWRRDSFRRQVFRRIFWQEKYCSEFLNPTWTDLSRDWYEDEPADSKRALGRGET